MRALVIGEAWGERERMFGHAFVGPSGQELARLLATAGLAPPLRNDYAREEEMIAHWHRCRQEAGLGVTNVFPQQPPGNNVFHFFDSDGDRSLPRFATGARKGYVKPEFRPHVDRLYDEIRINRPNVLIPMGNSACWATLEGQTQITKIRGAIQWSRTLETKVLPTYHPAYILRQWSSRAVTLNDLIKANREAHFAELRRIRRYITIPSPDAAGIREIHDWMTRPAELYSVDIETAVRQITMTGFARTPTDALVIPTVKVQAKQKVITKLDNYWPTPELEAEAWKAKIELLQSDAEKVFQNGIYDISYFLRMGIVPRRCTHDTMLRHHSMFPELPKALGFLASLYTDEVSWKFMRTDSLKRDE